MILMLFLGDVYELINHATFVMTVAYFVTTTTVFYFRWKRPKAHRPIRVRYREAIDPVFLCVIILLGHQSGGGGALVLVSPGSCMRRNVLATLWC